jgi:hypothetical protein
MPVFALGDIIRCISYVFNDKKFEIRSTRLRMNPSTHSANWKKIRLFLQGLVEVHVVLYLFFSRSFIL